MEESSAMVINRCMDLLRTHVGVVDAERFLFYVRSDDFDYTRWQKEHYDKMSPDELKQMMAAHSKEHPFDGKKAVII